MQDIIINLDGTAEFFIDTEDEFKQTVRGKFIVKCYLSPIENIKADRFFRQLLGEHLEHANKNARDSAFALSQLKYRIIKHPPFWAGEEIDGENVGIKVLIEIMNKALESQELYIEQAKKETQEKEKTLTKKIEKEEIVKEDDSIKKTD